MAAQLSDNVKVLIAHVDSVWIERRSRRLGEPEEVQSDRTLQTVKRKQRRSRRVRREEWEHRGTFNNLGRTDSNRQKTEWTLTARPSPSVCLFILHRSDAGAFAVMDRHCLAASCDRLVRSLLCE